MSDVYDQSRDGWTAWIASVATRLSKGLKVMAPGELGHPSRAGFRRLHLAQNAGQLADWGLSLPDGSRIHVHEYRSGALVVHRDKHDPSKSVKSALKHVATETHAGRAAAVGAIAWAVTKVISGGAA